MGSQILDRSLCLRLDVALRNYLQTYRIVGTFLDIAQAQVEV